MRSCLFIFSLAEDDIQVVIGQEAKKQFEKVGDYSDMIFAPCGGGANFTGELVDFEYPEHEIEAALARFPKVD